MKNIRCKAVKTVQEHDECHLEDIGFYLDKIEGQMRTLLELASKYENAKDARHSKRSINGCSH